MVAAAGTVQTAKIDTAGLVFNANTTTLTVGTGTGGSISGANTIYANYYYAASGISGLGYVNFTSTSNVSLGTVANVHITGGTSGYILKTDGSGTLSWIDPTGYSGFSGKSGFSGTSGTSGVSGYSGTSGVSGWSGTSGVSGWSGTSGVSGFSGRSGFSGSGVSGFSGSGVSGWSGTSGVSGWSGTSGFSGQPGYVLTGVTTGIAAAGTVQANATVLTTAINVVSTVSAGQGVVLPAAAAGMRCTVMNTSVTDLNVYPASSEQINSLALNVAYVHIASARLDYVAVSTVQWYTLNATFA